MRAAAWLIKTIHQRQRTLYHGHVEHREVPARLPRARHRRTCGRSCLKDVANDIGMHESTVSRATANKYVHTPQGTFELKYFFTSSLRERPTARTSRRRASRSTSARSSPARTRGSRYSDQYIAELLAKESIDIARRTVAKYRELMGILPSSKRKQVY